MANAKYVTCDANGTWCYQVLPSPAVPCRFLALPAIMFCVRAGLGSFGIRTWLPGVETRICNFECSTGGRATAGASPTRAWPARRSTGTSSGGGWPVLCCESPASRRYRNGSGSWSKVAALSRGGIHCTLFLPYRLGLRSVRATHLPAPCVTAGTRTRSRWGVGVCTLPNHRPANDILPGCVCLRVSAVHADTAAADDGGELLYRPEHPRLQLQRWAGRPELRLSSCSGGHPACRAKKLRPWKWACRVRLHTGRNPA